MMKRDELEQGQTTTGPADAERIDPRLQETLGNFRASIHAWSEAAFCASAVAVPATHRLIWRRTVAWALGVLLTAGTASGALYERHHQQVLREQARQRELQQERERALAAKRAADMDELLAKVDEDVSQEVPDALEPLAQMMTEGGNSK
ncbi:MAG TPA: hypothetical protein VMD29_05595 [Terracidiphilus sp.]|nr:hypothetical protein [Terracidiphilus sp.]